MRNLEQWLDEYSQSHQNSTNKRIHWLCVPAILFSLIGVSWHLSTVLTIVLLAMMLSLVAVLPVGSSFYIALFVVAWIGQFYGHKVEGKKPSFFKDLQFLMIGPAWCVDAWMKKISPDWRAV